MSEGEGMIKTALKHTQEEIVARVEEVGISDMFGAHRNELISALDFEHAKDFLKEGVTEEGWKKLDLLTSVEDVVKVAKEYLEFAVEKAGDHRGLSASRSVDHYRGWVWLAAPESYEKLDQAGFENYGAPQLKAAAEILGFLDEWDRLVTEGSRVARMALGEQCGGWDGDGCDEGCGR